MARVRASSLVAISLLACLAAPAASGSSNGFDQRLAEAERLRAEAAAIGAEWLETASLLDKAREAAAAGDTGAALALLEEAKFQAEAAIRQAEHEADAWQKRVIR